MNKITYPKLHDVSWLKKNIEVKTLRQIAEELGCNYSAVQSARKKYGLQIPHRYKYKITETKSIAQKEAYRKKYPNGRFGDLHPRWSGGRKKANKLGYVYIYSPNHPRKTKQRYVMEHILIAEKNIGRYLKEGEIVHHINGDKTDNSPENLKVLLKKDHVREHFAAVKEVDRLKKILDENGISY